MDLTRHQHDITPSSRGRDSRGTRRRGRASLDWDWSWITVTLVVFSFSIGADLQAQSVGWRDYDLPGTEGRAVVYLPPGIDVDSPNALVVFLHGAGGRPHHYRSFVQGAARSEGVVVVLPESSGFGWGLGNDVERIASSVELVQGQLNVDPRRIGIAGHSAGGGMALLVGLHPTSIYNAVFQMSSPFVAVGALPPAYSPPLRQYYGVGDPNHAAARPLLNAQWSSLDLVVVEQIEPAYGHSDWPPGTIEAGFRLIRDTERPLETLPGIEPPSPPCGDANRLCLLDEQFEVEVQWTTQDGASGAGQVSSAFGADSGVFWFFEPENWELMIKVIDGCAVNGHVWVFAAATTDVGIELRVRRRADGVERVYENPSGAPAPAITDTGAFVCTAG